MTTGIKLATSKGRDQVYEIAEQCGFYIMSKEALYCIDQLRQDNSVPLTLWPTLNHRKVKGLRLQVQKPNWFPQVDGIVTGMGFDDLTDRFPRRNPGAIRVLESLGQKIPDLLLREGYADAEHPSRIFQFSYNIHHHYMQVCGFDLRSADSQLKDDFL